jgi:hypothetical protein
MRRNNLKSGAEKSLLQFLDSKSRKCTEDTSSIISLLAHDQIFCSVGGDEGASHEFDSPFL